MSILKNHNNAWDNIAHSLIVKAHFPIISSIVDASFSSKALATFSPLVVARGPGSRKNGFN